MRLAKPLGLLIFVVNLTIAVLWLTILHPASSQAVGRAAGTASQSAPSLTSPRTPTSSSQSLLVGPMFLAPANIVRFKRLLR